MARLKDKYIAEIAPAMQEKFGYSNVMAIPKLDKIIINIGLGEAVDNPKALDGAVEDLHSSLVKNQLSLVLRNPSPVSKFVKVCQSA